MRQKRPVSKKALHRAVEHVLSTPPSPLGAQDPALRVALRVSKGKGLSVEQVSELKRSAEVLLRGRS